MKDRFVPLWNTIEDWKWSTDETVCYVYIRLILRASANTYQWKNITLEPGQLPFGRKKFAESIGSTEQKVRTAIKKLKSTNEITIKTSSQGSIITIVGWQNRTVSNQLSNQQLTNDQPATNHYKEDKKNKKRIDSPSSSGMYGIEGINLDNAVKEKDDDTMFIIKEYYSIFGRTPPTNKLDLLRKIINTSPITMDNILKAIRNRGKIFNSEYVRDDLRSFRHLDTFFKNNIDSYLPGNFNVKNYINNEKLEKMQTVKKSAQLDGVWCD